MTTAQLRDELRRQDDERQRTRYTRLFDTPPRKRKVAARLPAQLEVHADVNGGWWRVGLREGGTLYEAAPRPKRSRSINAPDAEARIRFWSAPSSGRTRPRE